MPAAIPDTLDLGAPVGAELIALIEARGKPGMIISDNVTEFTSTAMLTWAEQHIWTGTPMRRFCESLDGRMRDEFLNETLFLGLDHACICITEWADDHNHQRPHSALGYLTPAAPISPHMPPAARPLQAPPIACYSKRARGIKPAIPQ